MKIKQSLNNTFIIPVDKDYLVYSPLNGISALINKPALVELKEHLKHIQIKPDSQKSKLAELAQDILQNPLHSSIRKTGEINPEFLGIIPTRSCNGACNYCDFEANQSSIGKMTYALAAKSVDWYAGIVKSKNRNILDIHFFGGEPMMARDVIEVVVQRARLIASEQKLIPYFEISTNGQYDADDSHFLGQYFNKVVLSFDGPEDIHNWHRPVKGGQNSFKNAFRTANIISNSNAELCIRCCASLLNVSKMEEITTWLCEQFRLAAINFEILCPTPQTDKAGLFPPDPIDFAVHFQKSREIAKSYGVEVVYASDISGKPTVSSCPVGKDTAIVSPDGRISNCYLMPERWQHAGLDLDFGLLTEDGLVQLKPKKLQAIRNMVEEKPRCTHCFCQWSCAGGCHVGITPPGSSIEYDNFCKQTRLISLFSLLSNLGTEDTISKIIPSPGTIKKILNQKSDLILAFNE